MVTRAGSGFEADLGDEMQMLIFEESFASAGVTRWSVSDLDVGVTYRNGEEAARALGVTGGDVNNCLHGRQRTCGGHRLVRTVELRRSLMGELGRVCSENGTVLSDVVAELRSMRR